MSYSLLIIGIGTGNPQHMTFQAVAELNRADIVLIPRKGAEKDDLAGLRRDICQRFLTSDATRIVEFDLPKRDAEIAYKIAVADWHEAIAETYREVLERELPEGGKAALLVWGDPSLYDSTLRIIERLRHQKSPLAIDELRVTPGITSIQALCAAHAAPLNSIAEPVLITTGRRLEDGFPEAIRTVVVMLDGKLTFDRFRLQGLEIVWGAYLGAEDEILISGPLDDVADKIIATRAQARARKGWIMDIYILRKL